ncbi:hypothetical protein HNQ34_002991 [Anoxybacillus tepidamans]|uniref:Uncharacterized protein n=1 Tax=Anoxybacteroides tepidamans TaxID=265948 RepID=A0A7W8ISF9_9BACL|nr:hypothetical protein [Anoxybacillus tepidamans]MBB5325885.1 hypothetical protein [Anoxybacillus tepidamans]
MEERQGATFVLPLAAIIETGNHIAETNVYKNSCGLLDKESPWAQLNSRRGTEDSNSS